MNVNEITSDTNIGKLNSLRYRGYYYDNESGLYYLQSRYYNPEWGRFLNADDADILTATQMDLTDKNLFAYCDNNPIMRSDNEGDFWFAAVLAPVLVANPVGIAILAGVAVVCVVVIAVEVIDHNLKNYSRTRLSATYDPDPFARPGQKKQNRERKEKKKGNKDWKGNPNKRPQPPKKHTPGREHRKY